MTLFRAYDPELGRWLSADPIGEEGGKNLYSYVQNQTLLLWDPLGLQGKFPCPYADKDTFQNVIEGSKTPEGKQDFSKGAIDKYRRAMMETAKQLQTATGETEQKLRRHMNKMNLRMQQLMKLHGVPPGAGRPGAGCRMGWGSAIESAIRSWLDKAEKDNERKLDENTFDSRIRIGVES